MDVTDLNIVSKPVMAQLSEIYSNRYSAPKFAKNQKCEEFKFWGNNNNKKKWGHFYSFDVAFLSYGP